MATEFVAAVIALALFIIASSVGKPLEKILNVSRCLGEKTLVRLCLQKKNCSPERSNGSSSGAYALISPLCRYQAFPSPPINNTRTSHVLKPHLNVLIITPLPVTFHPESKMRSVLKVSLHHYSFTSF